jgi:RNase P protein component
MLRDALAIDSEAQVSSMMGRLNNISYNGTSAEQEMRDLGKVLLDSNELSKGNPELVAVITQELLKASPSDGVRLVSLSHGSAIGIIKEAIKRIRRRLKEALAAAPALLPQQDTSKFRQVVRNQLSASPLGIFDRQLVAGHVVMAANAFREVAADMKAYKFDVISDEDEDEDEDAESGSQGTAGV